MEKQELGRRLSHRIFISVILPLSMGLSEISSVSASDLVGVADWGDSLNHVKKNLESNCASVQDVNVSPPSFPLADTAEHHIICREFSADVGLIDSIAFVFGDDQLKLIEARGGAAKTLIPDGQPMPYLHYQVFEQGEIFVDQRADTVWLLSKEALHANLFTWSNPYLSDPMINVSYDQSAAIPPILDFDISLPLALPGFENQCPIHNVEEPNSIWLQDQPSKQTQVNCFGFEYAGFPRKIEAVYGDGALDVVWILTGKAEESRVRSALVKAFGKPINVNPKWEVFAGGRVALRKDKPEVLMLSDDIASYYRDDLGLNE